MGYRIATSPNYLVSPGNASRDGARGWLREFAAPCSGLGHEQALEIKWGQHPKRWVTRGFAQPLKGTPIAILVNGFARHTTQVAGRNSGSPCWLLRVTVLLLPGDGPFVGGGLKDSLVITVRFPCLKTGQIETKTPR